MSSPKATVFLLTLLVFLSACKKDRLNTHIKSQMKFLTGETWELKEITLADGSVRNKELRISFSDCKEFSGGSNCGSKLYVDGVESEYTLGFAWQGTQKTIIEFDGEEYLSNDILLFPTSWVIETASKTSFSATSDSGYRITFKRK